MVYVRRMPSVFRKGQKVRHIATGWVGIVQSVKANPIAKATVRWENGSENTIHQSSLEKCDQITLDKSSVSA